jgi:transposase-like protein
MNRILSIQHFAGKIKSSGWSAMREAVTSFVRRVLETVMSLEQQEQMGCQPYEHSVSRRDYASGTYRRILSTSYGVINDLTVPRLRRHPFTSHLLDRYKRRARQLDEALLLWYLQGESCRDVTRSLQTWAEDILSAQSVSRLLQTIDTHLRQWRERPLPSDLVAVWLDGFSVRVRVKHKVRSYTILAALGRHPDGRWELLSFRLAESESEQRWMELLHQMHSRGMRTQLTTQLVELFIHDGAGGIAEALQWDYPMVRTQRCLVHKLQNLLDALISEEHRQAIKHHFWHIYNAPSLPRKLNNGFMASVVVGAAANLMLSTRSASIRQVLLPSSASLRSSGCSVERTTPSSGFIASSADEPRSSARFRRLRVANALSS